MPSRFKKAHADREFSVIYIHKDASLSVPITLRPHSSRAGMESGTINFERGIAHIIATEKDLSGFVNYLDTHHPDSYHEFILAEGFVGEELTRLYSRRFEEEMIQEYQAIWEHYLASADENGICDISLYDAFYAKYDNDLTEEEITAIKLPTLKPLANPKPKPKPKPSRNRSRGTSKFKAPEAPPTIDTIGTTT